ncbi:MAG: hypothetical protein J3T61_07625, partial [Candidatus Brocadiales bacterium]|nr:hypothetical protein [Candidatus Bathyanammoxibius sp.]
MHRLREPRYFLSLAVLMFLGLCLYVAASEDTALAFWGKDEKAAAGESSVNTQEFFAKLREEALGPDDCGRVFPMGGLTATYTGPEKLFPAYGKYGKLFNFLPLIRWYDPAHYYNSEEYHPGSPIKGQFKNDECIVCHTIQTPGVVALWKRSKHAFPGFGKAEVGCDKCHGNDHQKL